MSGGVATDMFYASMRALVDSMEYKLYRDSLKREAP